MFKQQRTTFSVSLNFWWFFLSLKVPVIFEALCCKATVMPNLYHILALFLQLLYLLKEKIKSEVLKNYIIYHKCSNNNIIFFFFFKKQYFAVDKSNNLSCGFERCLIIIMIMMTDFIKQFVTIGDIYRF